jgi:NitT/TauT family transport system substrate-binding protein
MERRAGRVTGFTLALLALSVAALACGSSSTTKTASSGPITLRLGYFPNLTHATAIVGVEKGIFASKLGPKVTLRTSTFNAGPAAVEALFSGALDATYIGPGPTINAFQKSHGEAVRVVSGATSGGAALIVAKSITTTADLRGKKLATPQLGNTQDVALRYWLLRQGLRSDTSGGGDVHILPQDNSTTVTAFSSGAIGGAWVPEPYASRLVAEGGHVLVDERTLWPGGRFVTTQLIVRSAFLKDHPDVVRELLAGQVAANDFVNQHPAEAQAAVNAGLKTLTGKSIQPAVLSAAWASLTFTDDPIESSLRAGADHAVAVGLLKKVDLTGLYDLGPLNSVLKTAGEPAVSG